MVFRRSVEVAVVFRGVMLKIFEILTAQPQKFPAHQPHVFQGSITKLVIMSRDALALT